MASEDFSQDIAEVKYQPVKSESTNGAEVNDSGSAEAPGRDDDRKLFVGGLSWETTEKELKDYFGAYGEIESINVKTDQATGRSRGFAFIVYKSADSIDKVTAVPEHLINNKKVDPKKAKARHGKIFIGGLPTDLSDEDIKKYFAQFGNIVEVEMPFDKTKNQRKNFCFITFDSEQVVNELLKSPKASINGKEVDVKKATPKPDSMLGMRGGPRGARLGSRGAGRRGTYGSQGWGQGGYSQGYYGAGYAPSYDSYGYDYYGNGYGYGGYGDYSAGYGGYDYGNYDSGYSAGSRAPRGKGTKPRGNAGGRPRHQPY